MKPTPVVAEVAGKVWKIEIAVGAQVAAEDIVLILESMKMEIPVASPAAGTLLELRIAEGDMVGEGEVVAVVG